MSEKYEAIRQSLKEYVSKHETLEKGRKVAKRIARKKGENIPVANRQEKDSRRNKHLQKVKELKKSLVKAYEEETNETPLSNEHKAEFEEMANDKDSFVYKAAQWKKQLEQIRDEMEKDEFVSSTIDEEPLCGTNYFSGAFSKIDNAIKLLTTEKMEIYFRSI